MGRNHDPYEPGGPTRPPPSLPAPEIHARQHSHVRQAHETELIEDYVELIADLIDTRGEARAVEIAHRRGVRQATVSKMLQRLLGQQLIETEPYRAIFLTAEGRRMAEASRARHALVLDFLRRLGVPEEVARRDAEGIEHHVSAETLERMRRWLEA
ncbi:manganese-binding transcriptional regulator MntR [Halorhodospira neutriphila]|uniref:Transcriptional regulator MntR n=1 Tax=Halorhodospira neutriphila TaxID=168379 RepID=A0ABS1E8P5_9GAMM|nr:manganese-binding transcriptional regulator MntR [Halorhodospira neutriphila]MBK1726776.1 transcriptional regulator MntR [Halorhodospira neutriphila]